MIKVLLITFFLFSNIVYATDKRTSTVTTFTYHTKQSSGDKRFEYDYELLKLALLKTEYKYGAFKLNPLSIQMNFKRVEFLDLHKKYENLFFKHSVSNNRLKRFGYIPFPINRGIVGYRVGFISKKSTINFENIDSIEKLKKISILQGLGWLDVEILRSNGFKVVEGSFYEGLFHMIVKGRADIFLRGANELLSEWEVNKNIKNLTYDKYIVIYYPLPQFFFTHPNNTKAINRISEGFVLAYNDGSLIELWKKHYSKSIDFVQLHKRKIFKFENPYLKSVSKEYMKYLYTP